MGIGSHQSAKSKNTDWCTPPEIIAALGKFDLDPCYGHPRPFKTAKTMWSNGDLFSWYGRVWLNPPYGQGTSGWFRTMADHNNGIALVFARTETEMFRRYVWPRASSVFFFHGRLHFYTPGGVRAKANAGAPSVLISYDKGNVAVNAMAIATSGLDGKQVNLGKARR